MRGVLPDWMIKDSELMLYEATSIFDKFYYKTCQEVPFIKNAGKGGWQYLYPPSWSDYCLR